MASHTVPASYVFYFIEFARRWQLTAADILAGFDVAVDQLRDPHHRLPLATVVGILGRIRTLSGDPHLGYHLGANMRVTLHGYLGFAVMSARDVREGLALTTEFLGMVTTTLSAKLRVAGGWASYVLEERADLADERDTVLLAVLVGVWTIGEAMTGVAQPCYVDLAMKEPEHVLELARLLPRVRFNQPMNRLHFPEHLLGLPYVHADTLALALAREQCARSLVEAGAAGQLSFKVRSLLAEVVAPHFPSLDEVARAVRLTPRTLKRRLASEGECFSQMLDAERRERAVVLLGRWDVTVSEIAVRLGFSTEANFCRAFRRWTGSTPSRFRRSRRD